MRTLLLGSRLYTTSKEASTLAVMHRIPKGKRKRDGREADRNRYGISESDIVLVMCAVGFRRVVAVFECGATELRCVATSCDELRLE